MFKFATSALLAVSAIAVSLQTTSDGDTADQGLPPHNGPSLQERLETVVDVMDTNNDKEVTVDEVAEALFLAQIMEYIDLDGA